MYIYMCVCVYKFYRAYISLHKSDMEIQKRKWIPATQNREQLPGRSKKYSPDQSSLAKKREYSAFWKTLG